MGSPQNLERVTSFSVLSGGISSATESPTFCVEILHMGKKKAVFCFLSPVIIVEYCHTFYRVALLSPVTTRQPFAGSDCTRQNQRPSVIAGRSSLHLPIVASVLICFLMLDADAGGPGPLGMLTSGAWGCRPSLMAPSSLRTRGRLLSAPGCC